MTLKDTFTSTGAKFFAHQEVMSDLRDGKGRPVVTHVMLTDVCNHTCAFCSVQARAGDSLPFDVVTGYLDILLERGLRAVILSGGGNPILYKCKKSGRNINDVVDAAYARGLDIGLITNGMPLRRFDGLPTTSKDGIHCDSCGNFTDSHTEECKRGRRVRESWGTVRPETLDKLTWVRISMSGLDHVENEVFVPDHNPARTALGFSYVAHDIYEEPADPHHGKVSRPLDLISGRRDRPANRYFEERIDELKDQMSHYVRTYRPRYLRLLPNCLEPELIPARCRQLEEVARFINFAVNREVAFVQYKPPAAPRACFLGYIHPVLNCDGYVYPCDSCVLNEAAGHAFANPWRVCRWDEVGRIYEGPARSLIADPARTCPGCVFTRSNEILADVREGRISLEVIREQGGATHEHANFV